MSAGLRTFFVAVSWVLMVVGILGTIVMGLAIMGSPGPTAQKLAGLLPAAVMLLTLSFGMGAVLRVLVSIDQKLEVRS